MKYYPQFICGTEEEVMTCSVSQGCIVMEGVQSWTSDLKSWSLSTVPWWLLQAGWFCIVIVIISFELLWRAGLTKMFLWEPWSLFPVVIKILLLLWSMTYWSKECGVSSWLSKEQLCDRYAELYRLWRSDISQSCPLFWAPGNSGAKNHKCWVFVYFFSIGNTPLKIKAFVMGSIAMQLIFEQHEGCILILIPTKAVENPHITFDSPHT